MVPLAIARFFWWRVRRGAAEERDAASRTNDRSGATDKIAVDRCDSLHSDPHNQLKAPAV
jgi:hypothetical protein